MLTLSQMVLRFVIALALGGLLGLERELIKKTGLRTEMLVSGGAAIFAMVGLMIPSLFGTDPDNLTSLPDRVISNIVVGVGFLGAGLIFKMGTRVRGLTTAADIWIAAAVGMLVGLGLIEFAVIAAVLVAGLLYFSRKLDIDKRLGTLQEEEE